MTARRRGFLIGLGATLLAAPSIVRATNLMPISPLKPAPVIGGAEVYVSDFGTFQVAKGSHFSEAALKKAIREAWETGSKPEFLLPVNQDSFAWPWSDER